MATEIPDVPGLSGGPYNAEEERAMAEAYEQGYLAGVEAVTSAIGRAVLRYRLPGWTQPGNAALRIPQGARRPAFMGVATDIYERRG